MLCHAAGGAGSSALLSVALRLHLPLASILERGGERGFSKARRDSNDNASLRMAAEGSRIDSGLNTMLFTGYTTSPKKFSLTRYVRIASVW